MKAVQSSKYVQSVQIEGSTISREVKQLMLRELQKNREIKRIGDIENIDTEGAELNLADMDVQAEVVSKMIRDFTSLE